MPRRFSTIIAILTCSCFILYGCSDDEPTTGGGGTDAGGDSGGVTDTGGTGGDTGGTGSDTGGTGNDVTADAPQEVEQPGEPCEGMCTASQECRGNGCVDEISEADYETAVTTRLASYWYALQLPSELGGGSDLDSCTGITEADPTDCCFDYDDDPDPDNQLGAILGLLGSVGGGAAIDVQGTLDAAIESGSVTIVSSWSTLPEGDGPANFDLLLADLELDEEGEPVQDFTTRAAGDGEYTINPDSLDRFGPQVQFNDGSINGGVLAAGPSQFILDLTIDALSPDPIQLTLENARISGPVTIEDDGVHTVDGECTFEGVTTDVAGGLLGGVVEAGPFMDILDEQMRLCDCGGIDPNEEIIRWSFNLEAGTFEASCNPDNDGSGDETTPACGDGDGGICEQISTVCGLVVSGIGFLLDVDNLACEEDTSGGSANDRCGPNPFEFEPGVTMNPCNCTTGQDGITDSISMGIRFALTGATVTGLTETE